MKIYPAIDILNGRCVRLEQGNVEKVTDYGDPVEVAKRWQSQGANYIHLVDLDAAISGTFTNRDVIADIVHEVKIPVQMGGGVRTAEDISIRLDKVGISRVILGTVAVEEPEIVEWAISKYKDRIIVGIDAKNGKVAIKGWAAETSVDPVDLAVRMRKMGVSTIAYTDILRDGMLEGPNIEKAGQIVKKTWMNMIVSGGITTLEDIERVKGTGASGCIIGRALYTGDIDLKEAMIAAK
ncbi:MAG: 1-(5-phosphoribosyl)-5-[(5-phosphoribosylamino)methylideneamino]imidazole-4-carboxamide isomerase [Christensenellaceae bacterium]|jgi:phosphoribosylformimino-5-aminoimidazole carboxamide ribotide isomerase